MIPALGSYAVDTRSDRTGRVVDRIGGLIRPRPPGGEQEWNCPADALRPAGTRDELDGLRARVTETNRVRRLP